ncbi:MAG: alpha/beta fold hydrolase [Acidimicrobiales bacterium]
MTTVPLSTVKIHGHEVRYRRAGPLAAVDGKRKVGAEPILLIHGLAGSSLTWQPVMTRLAEYYDVIAPDLLGHGESAKPMGDYSLGAMASGLRDLLAILDVPRVTVIGQSFGGGVAMQLAYQHPELCDRLVLVGSGGLGREVSWMLRLCALPGAEQLMPLVFPKFVAGAGNAVGGFLHQRGLRSPLISEMWRAYSSLAGAENRKAFVRTMRGVIEPGGQTVSALDRLYLAGNLPTLIVWGDHDNIIPVAHAHTAHEAIPGSRLEILDGVGHFPHAEDPERFVEVLCDFMATTEPGPINEVDLHDALTADGD